MTALGLNGWLDKDYHVEVTDLSGRTLDSFQARAGSLNRAFAKGAPRGIAFVRLSAGTESHVIRAVPL
jgi:hypothetical protein